MSLYQQQTPTQQFVNLISAQAARTLARMIAEYKLNRALFLGLPVGAAAAAGQPARRLAQPKINLRSRLAAFGTNVGPTLADNSLVLQTLQTLANHAAEALGGFGAINSGDIYGFLLADATQVNGAWTYALPTLPFTITLPSGDPCSVNIVVNPDNSGYPTFTDAVTGESVSPDPL